MVDGIELGTDNRHPHHWTTARPVGLGPLIVFALWTLYVFP